MSNRGTGRPRLNGERYPSGQLKRQTDPAALVARMRTAAIDHLLDPKFGTQVGRLLMLRQLAANEASAAFRLAEIYGRYETQNGLRRSSRSPSYETGRSTAARAIDHVDSEETERRHLDNEEEWLWVQDVLSGYAKEERDRLEALCVEDLAISSLDLPHVKAILERFANVFDAKHRKRKRRKKKAALPVPAESAPSVPKVKKEKPAPPAPSKEAWLVSIVMRASHTTEAQIHEAYMDFVARHDRESFREDKQKKARVNQQG